MPPAAQNPYAPSSGVLVAGLPWELVASKAVLEIQLFHVYPLKIEPLSAPGIIDK